MLMFKTYLYLNNLNQQFSLKNINIYLNLSHEVLILMYMYQLVTLFKTINTNNKSNLKLIAEN